MEGADGETILSDACATPTEVDLSARIPYIPNARCAQPVQDEQTTKVNLIGELETSLALEACIKTTLENYCTSTE